MGVRIGMALLTLALVVWSAYSLTAQQGDSPASPAERIAVLKKRAKANPQPDVFFEMGRIQFENGAPREGFISLAKAVAIAPKGHYSQSYFLHQLDKIAYRSDISLMEELRKILPDYPPLLERIGRMYQGSGKDKQAKAAFDGWVKVRPESSEAYARLAEFQRATGNNGAAIPNFEKVRALMGESSYALRRLGVLYREEGQLDRSARALEKAIGLTQEGERIDVRAYTELGHTRMAQKRYKDAVTAFTQSVGYDGKSPAFRLFLAQAHERAGEVKKAMAQYKKAIELDKFLLSAQLGLGNLYVAQGDPKAALPHLREASSRNDRDPELHFLVGQTAIAAGDMPLAERELAKLKQIRSVTLARKLADLITAAKGS